MAEQNNVSLNSLKLITAKHGGGRLMFWACFVAIGPEMFAVFFFWSQPWTTVKAKELRIQMWRHLSNRWSMDHDATEQWQQKDY